LFTRTNWTADDVYPWACADESDDTDPLVEKGFTPQIYTLDLIARVTAIS
jgi:hypothetical protein